MLEQHHLDVLGLALACVGVFLAFPLYLGWDGGTVGAAVVRACRYVVGDMAYAAPVGFVVVGALTVMRPVLPAVRPLRSGAICLVASTTLALASGTLGVGPGRAPQEFVPASFERRGGIVGDALHHVVSRLLGGAGTHLVAVFLFLAALILLTGASVAGVLRATGAGVADTTRALRRGSEELAALALDGAARTRERLAPPEPEDSEPVVTRTPRPRRLAPAAELDGEARFPDLFGAPEEAAGDEGEEVVVPPDGLGREGRDDDGLDGPTAREDEEAVEGPAAPGDARSELEADVEWALPEAGRVLRVSSEDGKRPDTAGQEKTAARLVEALGHFGIEAQVIGAVAGPHITRYELRLAPGVKMSKVAQLKDDLAYALAATDIRILAPIPGKQAVGIEVPNAKRRIVQLGDVYAARPKDWSPLTVWLGKDVSGKAIAADLAKMPHVLVAGTTGAGKSGCVNAMLSSILLGARPDEVRLVLVDPKQVELNHYEHVPHLLTPVITSPRSAANALQNLVREMEWRYGIMAMARTRSLPELNARRVADGDEPLPYVLCVIDELADLMMVAPADVEDSIIRLAQKARAVGIHLVLATQSPRVDVITGMIKANVPSRIAFAVSSQTDSRVILDQNGAESLLGAGDMLFSPQGSSKLQRIQGAYIDEGQIEKLTTFWGRQGEPELREDLLEEVEPPEVEARGEDELDPDEDPLLGEAIQLVVEMGTASTSMLQRRLRLGYTRAGRLIDMLERRGVISGYEGSKPRSVLVAESDLPRVLAGLAERGDVVQAPAAALAPPPADDAE
ncbi:MAG TPA: DNA translocase FtsK 4TM domain-containing protein [Solirubrobacteraceae bacterium]|nr:DNA translocase FtsK 4TM domain-containing protein [Solirubrobacteraceae bacterium]